MSFKKAFTESSNPMLGEETYKNVLDANLVERGEVMTVQGAINKTLVLMVVMLATAVFAAQIANPIFMWVGIIGGAIGSTIAYCTSMAVAYILTVNLLKKHFNFFSFSISDITWISNKVFELLKIKPKT